MEERTNDLLDIFCGYGYATGREIIEKMGLANREYLQAYDLRSYYENTPEIEKFFQYFRHILEINPGRDEASAVWIDNHYGLRPEWRREMKLRALLDSKNR